MKIPHTYQLLKIGGFCFFLLSLVFWGVGCTPRPKNVLSAQQLEDILYDIHRADGILYVKGYTLKQDDELAKYYEVVLRKHGVSQAQFDSSLVWYTDNPTRFDKIYPRVVGRLSDERDQLHAYNQSLQVVRRNDNKQQEKVMPRLSVSDLQKQMMQGFPLQSWELVVLDSAFMYLVRFEWQDSLSLHFPFKE